MKLLVIGSQDAVWGFGLAGVQGQIVRTTEELHEALDAAEADGEIGIVLVTEDVANLSRQHMDKLKVRSTRPLVVEIPGPEGPGSDRPPLRDVVRRTIGVKI
jgi:vacuolar-type H+-ATPase subunit F/Vma7